MGYELLSVFKTEAEQLRNEIDTMINQLMDQVDAAHEDCKPEIYKDYKTLKAMIKKQKEENEVLQKHLDKERQKTNEQRNLITLCQERVLRLEEQVGIIEHNPNYFGNQSEDDLLEEALLKCEAEDVHHTLRLDEQITEIRP